MSHDVRRHEDVGDGDRRAAGLGNWGPVIAALIRFLFFRRVEAFLTDLRAFLYGCAMPSSIFHDRPDWPTAAFAPHDQLAESVDHGVDLLDVLLNLDHLRQS